MPVKGQCSVCYLVCVMSVSRFKVRDTDGVIRAIKYVIRAIKK